MTFVDEDFIEKRKILQQSYRKSAENKLKHVNIICRHHCHKIIKKIIN